MATIVEHKSGPNLLIRFIWWLFIGWWASGIVVVISWIALITIIGIPLGIYLINRLPTVLTLRPRSRTWHLGEDEEGRTVVSERGRPQIAWPIRGIWFVLVGWWASAVWMGIGVVRPADRHRAAGGAPDVQSDAIRGVALSILSRTGRQS